MTRAAHSSLPSDSAWPSAALVEALVDAALAAHRAGAGECGTAAAAVAEGAL